MFCLDEETEKNHLAQSHQLLSGNTNLVSLLQEPCVPNLGHPSPWLPGPLEGLSSEDRVCVDE